MLDSRSLPELAPEAHQDQGWASLAGKLYDDRGNRMGPSHAAKGGQRWRYYISRAILTGRKPDAGSVTRVPAAQIEKQVFDAIKSFVAIERSTKCIGALSPLVSGRTIRSSGKL